MRKRLSASDGVELAPNVTSARHVVPLRNADSIPIAGLVHFSTADWPGMLVATVFTQGCSWRCPYCHNPQLQDVRRGGAVAWNEVMEFLKSRENLLDGVVFSGGEPTRHRGVESAMAEVKEFGFAVGLHTNGMYPGRLRSVVGAGVVDWVGLDIKAGREAYDVAIGRPECDSNDSAENNIGSDLHRRRSAADVVWQSVDLVQEWVTNAPGCDFEVRTTLYDDYRIGASLPSLAKELAERGIGVVGGEGGAEGAGSWVLQRVREQGTTAEFRDFTSVGPHVNWDDVIAEVHQICPTVTVR